MPSSRRRLARAIVGLTAAACACAPIAIAVQGEWTALKVLTASAAIAAAIAAAALACGPARWWSALDRCVTRLRIVSTRDDSARAKTCGIWLVAIAGLFAEAQLVWRIAYPVDPWAGDDQGAYLTTAMEIDRDGGLPRLMVHLWSGEFAEANRHPLYLALLSFHPNEQFGRCLSALFALAALAIVTRLTWLRFGPWQAGIVAWLLAVNSTWGYFGGMVVCESLLMALSVFVWWQCLRLCDTASPSLQASVIDEQSTQSRSLWANVPMVTAPLIGVGLGLCYLTKGTGIVLIGCVLAWLAVEACEKWRISTIRAAMSGFARHSLLMMVAFLVVSSPLIARNVKRYGQPFYNINTYLLFADQYEGFEELLAREAPVGQVASEYLASHSIGDLARREASGLMWETYMIIRMLGPIPWDDARILIGMPLALLAVIGLMRAPPAHMRWLIVWCVLQWLIFAWYVPIAAGDRFVLPILAPVMVYAADGIVAVWKRRLSRNCQEVT